MDVLCIRSRWEMICDQVGWGPLGFDDLFCFCSACGITDVYCPRDGQMARLGILCWIVMYGVPGIVLYCIVLH